MNQGFTVGVWNAPNGVAHENYECDSCQFATISKTAMLEHQFHEDHRWPFAPGDSHHGPINQQENS